MSAPSGVSHENLQQPSHNRQPHSSGGSSNDCSSSNTQPTSSTYTVSSDNVTGFHQQQSSDVVHHDGHCDLQLMVDGQLELSVTDRDPSVILSPKNCLQQMTIAGQNSFNCEPANDGGVVKTDLEGAINIPNIVNESTWLFETATSSRSSSQVSPSVQSTLRNSLSTAEQSINPLNAADSVDKSKEFGGARSKRS